MNIRIEKLEDYEAVERLTYEAFTNMQKPGRVECDEHFLIHKMRKAPSFIPELSLVCEADGKIIGHIAYTKSEIVDANETTNEVITFGPLSVLPGYQKTGIGAALVKTSLKKATELGYKAVFITGHPEYYPKFGFVNAEKFNITMPDGSNMDTFMALPLYDGALDRVSGKWVYDPVFEIEPDELAVFNEKFGYK